VERQASDGDHANYRLHRKDRERQSKKVSVFF
jgi:hypothetical protein